MTERKETIDKTQAQSELTKNQHALGNELYMTLALKSGLSRDQFEECINSERHRERVQADRENAIASGGGGTPFSIVVTKAGKGISFQRSTSL